MPAPSGSNEEIMGIVASSCAISGSSNPNASCATVRLTKSRSVNPFGKRLWSSETSSATTNSSAGLSCPAMGPAKESAARIAALTVVTLSSACAPGTLRDGSSE